MAYIEVKYICMARRRKLRKWLVYVLAGLAVMVIAAVLYLLINFNIKFIGVKSVHDDAKTYKTKACLAFYPDSDSGKKRAQSICENAPKDSIFDYALIPYGDYYLVQYSEGTSYYVDHDYNDLTVREISPEGRVIISDYLRYSMKKDEIDEAYTYDFLVSTYYENIDLSQCTYRVDGKDLVVHFKPYDYDLYIPLKYMQEPAGIDLGYENELYLKPRYVSDKRKMIAFTFDDGPDMSLATSSQIVDKLYEFDSSATFFLIGYRLGEKQINFCRESVEKGMEYGSHTQNHPNLTGLSASSAADEIMIPYHDLYDNQYGFGYMMKTFRPPYGSTNATVDSCTSLTAVLWNVDSLDWSYRLKYDHDTCVDVICDKVISEADENDVVLFHDIYQTSVDAACELVEYFIKEGYQIVSASELIDAVGLQGKTHFSGQ